MHTHLYTYRHTHGMFAYVAWREIISTAHTLELHDIMSMFEIAVHIDIHSYLLFARYYQMDLTNF